MRNAYCVYVCVLQRYITYIPTEGPRYMNTIEHIVLDLRVFLSNIHVMRRGDDTLIPEVK